MNKNDDSDKDRLEVEKTFVPPLREAAITLHVMYEELRLAGFSRRDALFLISNVMVTSLFGPLDEQ
jgi:cytoplasmic iron level regulating protein YaaA (DUF328/UPF0246 family)